jgi:hypothetical protein
MGASVLIVGAKLLLFPISANILKKKDFKLNQLDLIPLLSDV